MREVTVSTSDASGGAINSSPVVLDQYLNPFSVGLICAVTGTATYSVQHSFDDPWASYATDYNTNATWVNSDDPNVVNATTTKDSNYAFAVRAVRLRQTAGNGSVQMKVAQAGIA